jgi:hypothetical protein
MQSTNVTHDADRPSEAESYRAAIFAAAPWIFAAAVALVALL